MLVRCWLWKKRQMLWQGFFSDWNLVAELPLWPWPLVVFQMLVFKSHKGLGTCAHFILSPNWYFKNSLHFMWHWISSKLLRKPQLASMCTESEKMVSLGLTHWQTWAASLWDSTLQTLVMYLCAGKCMRACACACEHTVGCRCQWRPEGGADSLQLELQAAGSHLVWVPGTELGFSARAARVLHCRATLQSLCNLSSKDRDLVPVPFQGTKAFTFKGYQRGARWVTDKDMEQNWGHWAVSATNQ